MAASPIKATIFAYQVGFGDCFLLRFDYRRGRPRHVLIDFGTTSLPDSAPKDQMLRVANDIKAKCADKGDGLDMLVATHRHADHISGFATNKGAGSGDVIAALNPKIIVQPWTEAPDAPLDWLGPEESASKKAFARRRQSLAAMHATAKNALAYLAKAGKGVPKAIADQLRFIGEDNLANLSAVRNLQSMAGRHEYVFHGAALKSDVELPGITIDVLGPPTLLQTESIRSQKSRDKDEFWQLAPKRLADSVGLSETEALFPNSPSRAANRMFTEYRWLQRRIDNANADLALSLVRALDDQMNNTSVILLMRAGNKTLLFPGDAQLENWQYALQSPLAALLDQVDVYKVGHHGSLNATPKSMWNRFKKRGDSKKKDRLQSVMSTKHGKHGSDSKNTEVPRRTLVTALDAESALHSTEKLATGKLYDEIVIPLT